MTFNALVAFAHYMIQWQLYTQHILVDHHHKQLASCYPPQPVQGHPMQFTPHYNQYKWFQTSDNGDPPPPPRHSITDEQQDQQASAALMAIALRQDCGSKYGVLSIDKEDTQRFLSVFKCSPYGDLLSALQMVMFMANRDLTRRVQTLELALLTIKNKKDAVS